MGDTLAGGRLLLEALFRLGAVGCGEPELSRQRLELGNREIPGRRPDSPAIDGAGLAAGQEEKDGNGGEDAHGLPLEV